MQTAFDFGARADIADIRDRLRMAFGRLEIAPTRNPMGQLVRSLISSRTLDAVSDRAYARLVRAYPRWADMAEAPAAALEAAIFDVTDADAKAVYLGQTLRTIAARHPDFDLNFLKLWSVDQSLLWLERLLGVGRKVAAATLNFSTLARPAFVADTHVLRVLGRCGFVGSKAKAQSAYVAVMAATDGWSAGDIAELHALLKRLGQTFCRARRTYCADCPITPYCRTGNPRKSGPPGSGRENLKAA